ncbi:unnamed protein product [Rotaria socialis]|uniref:Splicing factor Cactin n=1 Tax=Rotaria socialis TaxID=392032 RepID=A0A817MS25_9BILA|nr:unnamed protein product [Rotaria socialis]CAF4188956.1 unnamed protein product [Rotaria socialis]
MAERNNLFLDDKSTELFIWKKQLKQKGLEHISAEQLETITKQNIEKNKLEREKLEQQRLKGEKEKNIFKLIKAVEQHDQLTKEEASFIYNQSLLRAKVRINENRAKPIDILIYHVEDHNENLDIELYEPLAYLKKLLAQDLEELLTDIHDYIDKDIQQSIHNFNERYWHDIQIIVKDELKKHLSNNEDRSDGVHSAVMPDILEILKNKTTRQLEELEQSINERIADGKNIDISYWESLLSQLKISLARSRIQDRHQLLLEKKFKKINNEQLSISKDQETESFEDLEDKCSHSYDEAHYSPTLMNIDKFDFEIQEQYIDEIDDTNMLQQQRQSVMKSGSIKTDMENNWQDFISKFESDNDTTIGIVPIDVEYIWSDKYQPRKPRFSNRVHTGYEWNQYNRTHYDKNSPPPKTAQGYKFNIFYPNLIDKTTTPSYDIMACEDNKDFLIIKFHAGPPYEDIAFKIVNKEWNQSNKNGFRCQFQNNIFQLWFNFSKWKYRR